LPLSIHVKSVLEQMHGSGILQPIQNTSTEKAYEDQLFAAHMRVATLTSCKLTSAVSFFPRVGMWIQHTW